MFTREVMDKCIFDWRKLEGKTLKIRIVSGEGVMVVNGIDENGNVYILYHGEDE